MHWPEVLMSNWWFQWRKHHNSRFQDSTWNSVTSDPVYGKSWSGSDHTHLHQFLCIQGSSFLRSHSRKRLSLNFYRDLENTGTRLYRRSVLPLTTARYESWQYSRLIHTAWSRPLLTRHQATCCRVWCSCNRLSRWRMILNCRMMTWSCWLLKCWCCVFDLLRLCRLECCTFWFATDL